MSLKIQYTWFEYFFTLIYNPAQLEKLFKTLRNFFTKFRSKRMRVMSSANKLILISLLSIYIPFISDFACQSF